MNMLINNLSDLMFASESGPVFRSLCLPSRNPDDSVDFYSSFGFRRSVTEVKGLPHGFQTAVNDWHRLIFIPAIEGSPLWADGVSTGTLGGVIPRFVINKWAVQSDKRSISHTNYESLEYTDPDGHVVLFIKMTGSHRLPSAGMLCWVDYIEAFCQSFIRFDLCGTTPFAEMYLFRKRSSFLNWTPGKAILFDQRSKIILDPVGVTHLVSWLRSASQNQFGVFGEEHLADHTFYRFIVADADNSGLEITVPLSQIESCFARLNTEFRALFMHPNNSIR